MKGKVIKMALENLDQLSGMHIDVLREIGNIGSGNAATSLSTILNNKVNMDVPIVHIDEVTYAIGMLGGPENVVIGILSRLSGDVGGLMMFIIQQDFAQFILKSLLGMENVSCGALTEMELSAISEIGNILISSYVSAIAALSQLNIKTSVPAIAVDMVGAILSVPAIEMGAVSDKIIFIEDAFISENRNITANMMLVPDMPSLGKILSRLGIEL